MDENEIAGPSPEPRTDEFSPSEADRLMHYQSCLEKGRNTVAKLESFEIHGMQTSHIDDVYDVQTGKCRRFTPPLEQQLEGWNVVKMHSSYTYVQIENIPACRTLYLNRFSARHGIILCDENYKIYDEMPEERRVFSSEALW